MKNSIKIAFVLLCLSPMLFAGNEDRVGSAGASDLLINPWARSSGWGASNVAGVAGLEGQYVNIAGLASTEKTELIFAQTSWLQYGNELFNADESVSSISSFGFSLNTSLIVTVGLVLLLFVVGL
mgnify:CR=1 FL=1